MTYIHPNTPPKLAARFKKAKSYHVLAEQIGVNVRYVFELLTDGKEPNDTTPKLREIRRKMFLSARRKNRKAHRAKPKPMPAHRRWWDDQDKENLIRELYEINKDKP